MTLVLNRSQLTDLLDTGAVLDTLRSGFAANPTGITAQRIRTDLPGPGTATALIPGLIDGIPAYTVKVNAKFPAARPALRGVVCLHDLHDGTLLALMDSASLTAWRTGLAAALATHTLARPDATSVAVIGAGAQATMTLQGLRRLRPLGRLTVCDTDPAKAQAFADRFDGSPQGPGDAGSAGAGRPRVETDAAATAHDADIVITATWSRRPLLTLGDLRPGAHVTTLGADEPGKIEIGADVLLKARTVVDDVDLAVAMGALGNAGLRYDAANATLAQVLRGEAAGRENEDQITVYAPVGLPWQDLAIAWPTYLAATNHHLGTHVDLLA